MIDVTTPTESDDIVATAFAPDPPPPDIVIIGASVYPNPFSMISMEVKANFRRATRGNDENAVARRLR